IFLQGEDVAVAAPNPKGGAGAPADWRLLDYEGNVVGQGTSTTSNTISLGKLPIGYYELYRASDGIQKESRVTIGVIAPLLAPTPLTSPIGVDDSMAWHYSGAEQENAASLCALAGVNWVRDRLSWRDMEPAKGKFAEATKYDDTARKQSQAGLQVLQV